MPGVVLLVAPEKMRKQVVDVSRFIVLDPMGRSIQVLDTAVEAKPAARFIQFREGISILLPQITKVGQET